MTIPRSRKVDDLASILGGLFGGLLLAVLAISSCYVWKTRAKRYQSEAHPVEKDEDKRIDPLMEVVVENRLDKPSEVYGRSASCEVDARPVYELEDVRDKSSWGHS